MNITFSIPPLRPLHTITKQKNGYSITKADLASPTRIEIIVIHSWGKYLKQRRIGTFEHKETTCH